MKRERRRWPRLDLELQVIFATPNGDFRGEGTTVDVSAGGARFRTPDREELQPGMDLNVWISGMGWYSGRDLFRRVKVRAEVVRVDSLPEGVRSTTGGEAAIRFQEPPRLEMPGRGIR